jgi:hypothetical integral membrane protein (TIGR02206 family)
MQTEYGFEPFGAAHLITLSVIVAAAVLLPLVVRGAFPAFTRPVAYLLAALLLAQEVLQSWMLLATMGPTVELLPLHLCTLSVYLTAWTLIAPGPRVFEVAYFWGLGGGAQALLTPDLIQGFPAPRYLLFFLGHGLVVVGVLYATLSLRLRPYPGSLLRVPLLTLSYAALIFAVNLGLDTNFLYLMAKPGGVSILDWFGPWPWYWLGLIAIGVLTFALLYMPFFLLDLPGLRKRRRYDVSRRMD